MNKEICCIINEGKKAKNEWDMYIENRTVLFPYFPC